MTNVILQGIVGSTAYGLAHEDSDVDRLGIYVAPLPEVLGLRHDKVVDGTKVDKDPLPDKTLHEIGKYMSLALQCNPTILELMFLVEHEIKTPTGKFLIKDRGKFLSTNAVKGRFGGYATAQAERLRRSHDSDEKARFPGLNAKRTAKHGRHCARLLLQGAELLRTGSITVNVSEHRDFLFEVGRMALNDTDKFYETFLKMREDLDNADSVLNDEPDREYVEDLLISMRLVEAETYLSNVGYVSEPLF